MKLQKILSFAIVAFVASFFMLQTATAQNGDFPLNFDKAELENALENGYDIWHYQAAALSGTIVQIEEGSTGNPYFLLQMEGKQIWISCSFDASAEAIVKGDKVRVLGFLGINKTSRSYFNPINKTKCVLVAMAVKNDKSGEFSYNEGETEACVAWENGRLPDPRYP
jgi:hypothetical protein